MVFQNRDCSVLFQDFSLHSMYFSPLSHLSFSIQQGESIGLIGPASSGKTMLINSLNQNIWHEGRKGADFRQEGLASILGHQVSPTRPSYATLTYLSEKIATVTGDSSWLPVSIAENFSFFQSFRGAKQPQPYEDIIDSLPLSNRLKAVLRGLAELSPSQVEKPLLQHLAIIRCVIRNPEIILLDDPFWGMDIVLLRATERLLLEHLPEDKTIVWATNDLSQASRVTERVIFMLDGKVLECTSTADFFTNPQSSQAALFIAGRDDFF